MKKTWRMLNVIVLMALLFGSIAYAVNVVSNWNFSGGNATGWTYTQTTATCNGAYNAAGVDTGSYQFQNPNSNTTSAGYIRQTFTTPGTSGTVVVKGRLANITDRVAAGITYAGMSVYNSTNTTLVGTLVANTNAGTTWSTPTFGANLTLNANTTYTVRINAQVECGATANRYVRVDQIYLAVSPANLASTGQTSSSVALSWAGAAIGTAPSPARYGYNVYYSTTNGGPYTKHNASIVSGTAYNVTGLSASTTYYFVVTDVSVGADGTGGNADDVESPNSIQLTQATGAADATPPTAGTVTVSPASGSYVPAAFTITTQFTDAESAVTSCQYTLNNGGAWAAGTVSGAGPYTCTANVTGQTNGAALAINMRATSSGGTGTATKIDRTVDAAGPTDGTLTPTAGNTQVVLNWTAATDAASGLRGTNTYKLVRGNAGAGAPADCNSGTQVYLGTLLTATATGLVNGSTYGFRVCAYDAFDNLSAGTTASATPTACTETATVAIREPVVDPISGAVSVYADLGGTGGSGPQVATAAGGPWTNSPLNYTPPVNSTGSVTFYARATGSCATISDATPVTVTYDTRTGTVAGTATAAGRDASILVTAPYSADGNANNTLTVKWVLAGGNFATPLGTQVLAHAANPYSYTIPGLTNGAAYDVQVTYADVNGIISGTAVQTITNIAAMNMLMHNSQVTGSTKWPIAQSGKAVAGWGITDSKYGKFDCATCHEKNASPNIKRIKDTITAPDAAPSNIPGSAQTVTLTTVDQVANPAFVGFGNDTGGHASSNKVCEVCHSITSYHRYNTIVDPDGGGPLTAQVDLGHYNNQDCTGCHKHQGGFKAGCDSCHGNPPTQDSELVYQKNPPPLKDTGSRTWGKHNEHIAVQGYGDCNNCHNGWQNSNQMPDTTNTARLNLGFSLVKATGSASIYDGRAAGSGYTAAAGTTVNVGGNLTCANYCHGASIGGSQLANAANPAKWSDAVASWSGTCGTSKCHGTSAATPPANPASSLSHLTHAGTGGKVDLENSTTLTGTVMACSACHGAGYTGGTSAPAGHADGKTQFNVASLTRDYRAGTGPFYNGVASGDSGAVAPSNPYKTCTNLACHWGTTTPLWNAVSATCTTCHNNGNNSGLLIDSAPATGKHADHVDASATYVTCVNCHGTGATTGTHAGHIDGTVNFYGTVNATDNNLDATDFVGEATRGVTTDDTCAVVCHKDGDWGDGSVATTATVAANRGKIDWTVDCSNVPVVDFCLDCHSDAYSAKAGPTVVTRWLNNGAAGLPIGSHLKATTAETLPGEDLTCTGNDVADWKAQCQKCHTKHSGTVQIPLPPTSWDNPGTAAVETTNMRTQLGISYAGADHGAIKLGGTSTSGSNEADLCWNCHGTSETVNEWAYNQDTNGASFPVVAIADRNAATAGSHNYGYIYTTSARTVKASAWVDASGNGYWHQDGYSTATQLQRQIKSVHSVNFTPANQKSSVGTTVNVTTGVVTHVAQETSANIRCTYCHDVHDLNLAVADTSTGRPFLRGSWMGNPYPPDLPPLTGYTYPTTGGPQGIGNRWAAGAGTNPVAVPRLWTSTSMQAKGGYFLDQNSGWPTQNTSYDTLAETAGICTTCHGTDVDNMDFYPNSTAATTIWRRASPANGHANAALGGTGRTSANASNIFDGRRGATVGFYMALQDMMTATQWGRNRGPTGQQVKGGAPFGSTYSFQPEDGGTGPARNLGWYGGTENTTTLGAQYATWYSGNTTLTNAASIGNNGTTARAHDFTCSKCHSPHASGLPALLITNCLDRTIGTWTANANTGRGTVGPNGTSAWLTYVQNNCHRKDNTTSGWHRLATGQ